VILTVHSASFPLAITSIVVHALQRALGEAHDTNRNEEGLACFILTIVLPRIEKTHSNETAAPRLSYDDKGREGYLVKDEEPQSDCESSLHVLHALSPRIQVNVLPLGKRPILTELIQKAPKDSSAMLLCCGPADLCDASRQMARMCDYTYFEEPFGW
jgi:hypothetical protein